ncbi:MAG: DUF1294 domain-containing protein [Acutalibacteraceae bacterium]
MRFFWYYILIVSAVSIFATVLDKRNAKVHRRRVPEKTLLLLAVLGGSAAMYGAMRLIRHKTRHKKFMLGIPCIFLVQAACIGGYLFFLRG